MADAHNEGDVFRWHFKPGSAPHKDLTLAYWCKCHIAMFKGGVLGDIYWGLDDIRFIREEEVDLTFIGNINDYEKVADYNAVLYDAVDIMNLRHANNPGAALLLRKGATRSPTAAIEWCRRQIEDAEGDKRRAVSRIANLEKSIADIEAGKIAEVLL